MRKGLTTAITLALLGSGCSHSYPPPAELVDARVAYARAQSGPAAQLSPARLRLAGQALQEAEMSYGGAREAEVRDRAYVALRRAEAAEREAATIATLQRRQAALRELATLGGVHAEKARAELAVAEQRLSTEQDRARAAEQRASDEQTRAESAQQRAAEEQARAQSAEQRAESERQARLAAEARANDALVELSRQANVRREARGVVITLSGQVLFASDSSNLLPAAAAALDNVVAALRSMPADAGKVTIEGHTDSRGTRAYNRGLAERRATAVRNYLVSRGVAAELFVVEGVGPDRPVADNRSAEGRANNRRVEIVLPAPAFANLPAVQAAPAAAAPARGRDVPPLPPSEAAPPASPSATAPATPAAPGSTPTGTTPPPGAPTPPGTLPPAPGVPPPTPASSLPGSTAPSTPATGPAPERPATPPTAPSPSPRP